jgi:hypothetical protein
MHGIFRKHINPTCTHVDWQQCTCPVWRLPSSASCNITGVRSGTWIDVVLLSSTDKRTGSLLYLCNNAVSSSDCTAASDQIRSDQISNELRLPRLVISGRYLLSKLQGLQNKVLRTIGNFPRCTPIRDLHTAFNLPYVYDYITKLCRQQAEVIQIMRTNMFAVYDKVKPDIENIRGLNLAVVKPTTVQVTKLPL